MEKINMNILSVVILRIEGVINAKAEATGREMTFENYKEIYSVKTFSQSDRQLIAVSLTNKVNIWKNLCKDELLEEESLTIDCANKMTVEELLEVIVATIEELKHKRILSVFNNYLKVKLGL